MSADDSASTAHRSFCAALLAIGGDASACAGYARPSGSSGAGPNRDGISTETGLLQGLAEGRAAAGLARAGVGNGYSSFSTSGGRLYTLGARGGNEYVMALDRATGKKVWEYAQRPPLRERSRRRPAQHADR